MFGYGNVQIKTAAEIGFTTYQMVELAKAIARGSGAASPPDVAAEIEKLFVLMQKGIISGDEFAARKKVLLEKTA
jgi:hypothetical protein